MGFFDRNRISVYGKGLAAVLAAVVLAAAGFLIFHLAAGRPDMPENGFAEPPEKAVPLNGYIRGNLDFPGEIFPEYMRVYAYNLDSGEKFSVESQGLQTYEIEVPPGRYQVYAYLDVMPGYWAYYNEYVESGMELCEPGEPVVVTVYPGKVTAGVNPVYWDHYIDDRYYERFG